MLNWFGWQSASNQKIKGMLTSDTFLIHQLKDCWIKPIAHAFRMLFPAEKNYSMIEKSLGILFALLRNFIDSSMEDGLPYKWITDDY